MKNNYGSYSSNQYGNGISPGRQYANSITNQQQAQSNPPGVFSPANNFSHLKMMRQQQALGQPNAELA